MRVTLDGLSSLYPIYLKMTLIITLDLSLGTSLVNNKYEKCYVLGNIKICICRYDMLFQYNITTLTDIMVYFSFIRNG